MLKCSQLSNWLSSTISESGNRRYRHQLLKEDTACRPTILKELRALVQKAHEDAREHLRALSTPSLHPLGRFQGRDPTEGYPERLHALTLQGYFGEIFAGLIAENFSPFGESNWQVPAFLFRFHLVAFQQLEAYRQTNKTPGKAPGRTGDDCVAFQLDSQGQIIRYLYCEAKCTTDHDTGLIADAHEKVSNAVPVDFPQLIEILSKRSDSVSAQWCKALQQLWLSGTGNQCERLDLVSYVCGRAPVQKPTWISLDKPHEHYVANRRLETVEVHLTDVESLVKSVYCKEDEFCANV